MSTFKALYQFIKYKVFVTEYPQVSLLFHRALFISLNKLNYIFSQLRRKTKYFYLISFTICLIFSCYLNRFGFTTRIMLLLLGSVRHVLVEYSNRSVLNSLSCCVVLKTPQPKGPRAALHLGMRKRYCTLESQLESFVSRQSGVRSCNNVLSLNVFLQFAQRFYTVEKWLHFTNGTSCLNSLGGCKVTDSKWVLWY